MPSTGTLCNRPTWLNFSGQHKPRYIVEKVDEVKKLYFYIVIIKHPVHRVLFQAKTLGNSICLLTADAIPAFP